MPTSTSFFNFALLICLALRRGYFYKDGKKKGRKTQVKVIHMSSLHFSISAFFHRIIVEPEATWITRREQILDTFSDGTILTCLQLEKGIGRLLCLAVLNND